MNAFIPPSWIQVSKDDFLVSLSMINWTRDAYSDGEFYNAVGQEIHYKQKYSNGRQFTEKLPKRVAFHSLDGRYFFDLEFINEVVFDGLHDGLHS